MNSMKDFFANRGRRPHGGESTMKLPVRKKTGVYTWCTPWLCLWIRGGFPSFSHPKGPENVSPSQVVRGCVCWHHFPHSQGGSDGCTTAPAWAPLRQRPALNCSWLTATTNTPQSLSRELWWSLQEAALQHEKQEILFFSERLQRATCSRNIILHYYMCYKVPTILLQCNNLIHKVMSSD